MVEKILNNTTPYGKIRASHEGSLHSSTLMLYAHRARRICAVQIVMRSMCIEQFISTSSNAGVTRAYFATYNSTIWHFSDQDVF